MIKYSPRKTSAEQSLKVFPNTPEEFFLLFPQNLKDIQM